MNKPRYEYDPAWIRTSIEVGKRANIFSYRWGMWQHVITSTVLKYNKDTGEIETINSIYTVKEEDEDSSNS